MTNIGSSTMDSSIAKREMHFEASDEEPQDQLNEGHDETSQS